MTGSLFEAHRTGGGRALGGSIGQFERLLDLQIRQPLDFQDPAVEDVLLALLLDGQQALPGWRHRDGVDEVAQRDARLHCALEADKHRFRHVERHHARGRGKGDQARAGRERDADREARMAVAARADRVRQAACGSAMCG